MVTGPVSMPLTCLEDKDCAYSAHSTVIAAGREMSPTTIGGRVHREP